MADIKKFLDQAGVSTLWARVAEEVKKVDDKAMANEAALKSQAGEIVTMKEKIQALEAGTYDDSEVRGLISQNADAISANTDAITILNGDAETTGSVINTATVVAAAEVAKIVADANADFDTLKEIADWILNDTTGAADMANRISALQTLVGDEAVATQIANAIAAENLDQYALASELNALVDRVAVLENAGYQNAEAVAAAIDAKITALDLANAYDAKGAAAAAETSAKAYADSLAINYDAAGSAAAALVEARAYSDANLVTAKAYSDANLTAAKSYTDTEMAKIQALTTAEIDAAIAGAV